ncbi:MAG: methyltransferase domain-containing protein [Sulfuricurvum sp.]|nr:methyltransferase domain-containing protein [Sulfuricurvum sp.]MDD5386789.1 methyltransferase domain-containing protein [Sulfuricurvum sp.]
MRVREEFSRYASVYGECNVIQTKVAQKLLDETPDHPKRILDLGCGSGTIFSRMGWECERFIGVDFSQSMLAHHPMNQSTELILGDFNDPKLFKTLESEKFDHIYSASALQWADDLGSVLEALSYFNTPMSLAIFTAGTFKTLYECAKLPPLLKSTDEVISLADTHLKGEYEILHYTLEFDSVREMFRYIKRSGVSGGRRVLTISQMKKLMENYPLAFLEFEVLFISKS